jgi:uncharacterized protein YjiS (DUF1127 family)
MPTDLGEIMGIFKHAFGSLRRGVLALAATSGERRAMRMLRSFDSRTLADMGIKRGDIDFAVRHGRPSEVNVRDQPGVPRRTPEHVPPLHVILLLFGLARMQTGKHFVAGSSGGLRAARMPSCRPSRTLSWPPDWDGSTIGSRRHVAGSR